MRKKRKLRGRAERAALAAAAAEAGVEIVADEAEAEAVSESAAASESDSDSESVSESDSVSESESESDSESDSDSDSVSDSVSGSDSASDSVSGSDSASGSDSDPASDPVTASDPASDPDDEELEEDVVVAGEDASARPQAAALDEDAFTSLIEALLFAADKPLTIARLRQLTRVADTGRIQVALERVAREHAERGIVLSNVSGGYSFRTHSRFSPWVQQLIQGRPVRLSRAQLETLALVAYRQPITRPEIDQIRGVDSAATLKLLLDRSLIRILGKREEVGRPLLYGTTREFLDFFSLNDLRELPTLREYSELTEESRGVVERMGLEVPPALVMEAVAHVAADLADAAAEMAEAEADAALAEDAGGEAIDAYLAGEAEAVTETAGVTGSESESESEAEPVSESESEPEPESEPESESEPVSVSEGEAEAEGEAEVRDPADEAAAS